MNGGPLGTNDAESRTTDPRLSAAAVVGAVVLHLVAGFFTWTAVGLISIPVWAAAGLALLWVGSVVLMLRTARERVLLTPMVPAGYLLVLWATVAAGGAILGWNA